MMRHPSASTLWPNLTRITQRPSSAPWCVFRPTRSFFQLPCTLSFPDVINICIVLTRHTYATEAQGRKITPGRRDFSFSLLPPLLSNSIQVRKTDCWQYCWYTRPAVLISAELPKLWYTNHQQQQSQSKRSTVGAWNQIKQVLGFFSTLILAHSKVVPATSLALSFHTFQIHTLCLRNQDTSFSELYQLGILYGPNAKTKQQAECPAPSLQAGRWKAELQLLIPAIVHPADGNSQVFKLHRNIPLGL